MAAVTHVCTIDYVGKMLREDVALLEAITSNDDNLTDGNIVRVYLGPDETEVVLDFRLVCSLVKMDQGFI